MVFSLFKRIKPTGDNLVRYSQQGDLKAVRQIIKKGVHPDTKGLGVENALNKAIQNGHCEIVRLLIESGATMPIYYTNSDMTLFHWAVARGLYGYVVTLLEEGADINTCTKHGSTPLMTAADRLRDTTNTSMIAAERLRIKSINEQRFAIFKLILYHPDLDLNFKLKNKRKGFLKIGLLEATLLRAASAGHVEAVKLLLEKGADPSFRAESFEPTAYRAAKERNHEETMTVFREASRTIAY